MLDQLDFKSKNIFIGGSSKGIGWESAKLFSDFGGNVTLVSRNDKTLRQRISELTNNGAQNHNYIVLDFSAPNKLESELKEFVKKNSIEYDVVIKIQVDRQVANLKMQQQKTYYKHLTYI